MPNSTTDQKEAELDKKLGQIKAQGTEDEYKATAARLKLPFSNLAAVPVDTDALGLLPEETARQAQLAIILKEGATLTVVCLNPENDAAKTVVSALKTRGFLVNT